MAMGGAPIYVILFHLAIVVMYIYAIYYDEMFIYVSEVRDTYTGRFKYLTFWNEVGNKILICEFDFENGSA